DLPDQVDEHDESVYQRADQNFQALLNKNILVQDNRECYYIYQLQQGPRIQTGVLAKVSCSAYEKGLVRKHELTRPDKVLDRRKHIEALRAQVSPTLLTCKKDPALSALLAELTQVQPLFAVIDAQGVQHRIWRVQEPAQCGKISNCLNQHMMIYIADGHHRNEAAYQAYLRHPEYSDCLAGIFPEDELVILGYHRMVKTLNGETPESFIDKLKPIFTISLIDTFNYPEKKGDIVLYLKGQAFLLRSLDVDTQMDVDKLSDLILAPILAITDVRKDKNITFVGGSDAHETIKAQVDSGQYAAGFLLYPTSMAELLNVADAQEIMPPKSTWFEPKLADGLVSYLF
ncbi:MAG TPA: DUF1015 family protein, partial [Gammaproteobacteria bacterium]|nr:DUF1015 family protein [Gammaproteobacteria bacterium]